MRSQVQKALFYATIGLATAFATVCDGTSGADDASQALLGAIGDSNAGCANGLSCNGLSSMAPSYNYNIGTGIYDVTGAAAESNMWGYANSEDTTGLQQRLRSRAFVIESRTNGNRVVFVSSDLGAIFQSMKLEVVRRLRQTYGDTYTDDNVMLTATHTHVGTGGMAHYPIYILAAADKSGNGYSSQNFEVVVDGIYQSIVQAHNNLSQGSIEFVEGELTGATRNRSIVAYEANHDSHHHHENVNTKMVMLKFKRQNGEEIGMLNWFAVHPTSLSIKYTKLSGDNKGYAQHLFEKMKGTDYRSSNTFVAAFANSDEGDVVPVDGNANSVPGYQGSPDELLNAERAGSRQFNKALELYNQAGVFLDGSLEYRHRWANFEDYTVDGEYTGAGTKELCSASRGFSFAAGGENGPSNIPGIYEGMTSGTFSISDKINKVDQSFLGGLVRLVFGAIALGMQDPCQEEKPNLLATGALDFVPEVLPFQLFVIGDFALIGAPSEVTTMAGRRIRARVLAQLEPMGVNRAVIAGLANTYSGYLTTQEEFKTQQYEGASTEYGPYTLAAYLQEFDRLATAVRMNQAVSDDKQPADKRAEPRLERTGVVWDGKFFWESFGQVLTDANASYSRGEMVEVKFRGGHPKNNLKTQDSYLFVQRWTNGAWTDYLYDWDWETEYEWKRDGGDRSFNFVRWRISDDTPTGTYRIVHKGHWKYGLGGGTIHEYTGISRSFIVN